MGCRDLLNWPEDVLKILHVVFCGLAFVLLMVAIALPVEPYPNFISFSGAFPADLSGREDYIQALHSHWSIIIWIALILMIFICGAALLFLFLKRDPRKENKKLFIYYCIGSAVAFISSVLGIIYITYIFKFHYCTTYVYGGQMRDPHNACHVATTDVFCVVITAFVFTLAGCGCYITSAVYNYKLNKP